MFADDIKLFRCIERTVDADLLQADVNGLNNWSSDSKMLFNSEKCKVLRVSRTKNSIPTSYAVNDQVLEQVMVQSDLGVKINGKLLWTDQVKSVCSKANKMLGLIRRSTQEMSDRKARLSLYLQLVRSQICYASQVWCPQTVEGIGNIEKIQRRATKYILQLGFFTDIPYPIRLQQLDLMPIVYWHEYLDVVLLFKIMNNLVFIPDSIRPKEVMSGSTRHSSSQEKIKLSVPFAKTVTFQTSYTL